MEALAKTDYQDVYRISPGVLLVVNKFKSIHEQYIYVYTKGRRKKYSSNTKDLYINQKDYTYQNYYSKETILVPKGTILYLSRPVIKTENKSEWEYQLKTTGDSFKANYNEFALLLNKIKKIIDDENYDNN